MYYTNLNGPADTQGTMADMVEIAGGGYPTSYKESSRGGAGVVMSHALRPPTPAHRLVRYWTGIGCTVAPGVPAWQITAFEERYHVRLPADLREYFSVCNGLVDDTDARWDDEWLSLLAFWPFEQLHPLRRDADMSAHLGQASSYFVFADFLISSHEYSIRLTEDSGQSGPIIVDGYAVTVIATSFSDFIVAYLEEPDRVLHP
jgi:hypothetical protein